MPEPLTLDLWSDPVCPWCWIGKRRIENALASEGLEAQWRFHAYELGPREQVRKPTLGHLAEKYGVGLDEARAMVARVQDLGRALGLDINPDKQQTAATYDAHRLVQAAQADGDARALVERLHRAHFSEGLDISDAAVLRALAAECGMDARRAREVLDGDAYAGDVERDERDAALRGIGGVPYTVLGGRLSVSGAQSVAVFSKALRQASGSNALGVNL